jgi:hypothetical protein
MSAPFGGFIGLSFARRRLPRRYDPDSHPSPGVDHNQKLTFRTGPEGDEPLLVLCLLLDREGKLIAEDGRRIREVDLVLPEIGLGLAAVPLIPFDCMHARTPTSRPLPAAAFVKARSCYAKPKRV